MNLKIAIFCALTLKVKVNIIYDITKDMGRDFLEFINEVFPIANNHRELWYNEYFEKCNQLGPDATLRTYL